MKHRQNTKWNRLLNANNIKENKESDLTLVLKKADASLHQLFFIIEQISTKSIVGFYELNLTELQSY